MNMKGSLPLLILHILSRGPKHGYGIAKTIRQQSDGLLDFAEGTLYPTLHDLEQRGLIEAFEQEVRGRARRTYRLTDSGHGALAQERAEWQQFSRVMNVILGEA
ncbi:MAG: helix-turn-helix transcriptional regulator [Anaerolineae bacterium]|nr:helix-turn-helix transcriptional regulator [Anaerolineae bacterium]